MLYTNDCWVYAPKNTVTHSGLKQMKEHKRHNIVPGREGINDFWPQPMRSIHGSELTNHRRGEAQVILPLHLVVQSQYWHYA